MSSFLPIKELKQFFPQAEFLSGRGEAYLDSASSSLRLQCVIDAMRRFYEREASNVHRGDHRLSLAVMEKYEKARESAARFIGADSSDEIIFTKGTTEGLNFLASALQGSLKEGDEILLSEMEHHSNLLPWQILAERSRLKLKFIPVTEEGDLDLSAFEALLTSRTKIVSVIHVSNALGTVNPVRTLVQKAKAAGALAVIDGAQSVSCLPVSVKELGCDFFVFSGHKIFAPSGVGVLFARRAVLEKLPPYQTGGGMISDVSLHSAEWADIPQKFEAGTPFIEGALALGAALDFIEDHFDFNELIKFERELVAEADASLSKISGFKRIGAARETANILSFVIEGMHASDLSLVLAQTKAALRAGHHCCLPLMKKLNLSSGTLRASFSVYNSLEDVWILQKALKQALSVLR